MSCSGAPPVTETAIMHPDGDQAGKLVIHADAPLSERGRPRLARLIVEQGWPIARPAARMQVAWPTAKRWADRYRAVSRQAHFQRVSPRRPTSHVFRKTAATELDRAGLSARQIADQLGHAQVSMTQDRYLGRRGVDRTAADTLDKAHRLTRQEEGSVSAG